MLGHALLWRITVGLQLLATVLIGRAVELTPSGSKHQADADAAAGRARGTRQIDTICFAFIPLRENDMTVSLRTLDVRAILNAGGEPLAEIMNAVAELESGQGLRLLTTFKPVPLFSMMQKKGYTHYEKELGGGDWETVFKPDAHAAAAAPVTQPGAAAAKLGQDDAGGWPAPSRSLDNRGMMPPEPMVITLEAIENMAVGEVLEGWYDRDPLLLYPELQTRGHQARCEKRGPSEYRVLIRCGAKPGSAS
jgi:uncharacterized protein (DUF2249 family)